MADFRHKITDDELKAIVDAELEGAMGEYSGELADDRATALQRYLGEPMGNETPDRSQVQTRDVMEVVEWILPSLIRIFTNADRAVEIEPFGPEDEEQAKQETDFLNWLFYKQNSGFLILYTFFKDALLQKNGIVKCRAEEYENVTTETYHGLSDQEFAILLSDDDMEIIEHEQEIEMDMMGQPVMSHSATFKRTNDDVRICIDNLPPEEFLISRDARSPNPKDARFLAHKTTKTVSELFEMGYSEDQIRQMDWGQSEIDLGQEAVARRSLTDEELWNEVDSANFAMRKVSIAECYIKADKNGDGVAELLKVFRSGEFIEYEEVDSSYIAAITPIILTHKFYGLSIADILTDIQEIRTALFRSYLDNIYQTVNGETFYDEDRVNVDDLLTSTPWGLRAVKGSPHDAVLKMPPSGLPPQAFTLFELTDGLKNQRIGDFQSQLDPDVLQNANTGVVINMLQEARAKVEMIARIFAETGVREMFRDLHELSRKHMDRETRFKLRNSWLPVNPSEWRERTNFTVKVGLGTRSQQERIAHLTTLFQMQTQAAQLGMVNVTPVNVHNTFMELGEAMGYTMPEKFSTDPQQTQAMIEWLSKYLPQQDPNAAVVQATMEVEGQKRQIEKYRADLEYQKAQESNVVEIQKARFSAEIAQRKADIDELKANIQAIKNSSDMSVAEQKNALDAAYSRMDQHLEKVTMLLNQKQHDDKMMIEKYKADLAAMVQVKTKEQKPNGDAKLLATLMDSIEGLREELSKPKQIKLERDAKGNLISVNGQKVERDENGRITGVS